MNKSTKSKMNKIARILFLIVGCIFPLFIGGLHTLTHFRELLTPEIFDYLQKEVPLLGEKQTLWNVWGMVSFMMGASFIVLGLLNISISKLIPKTKALPVFPIVAVILYQLCVIYVGYEYKGAFQFYGGILGIILISICLILTLSIKEKV